MIHFWVNGYGVETKKTKLIHTNGNEQKSRERTKNDNFSQVCRFCSFFTSIARRLCIVNSFQNVVPSIRNMILELSAVSWLLLHDTTAAHTPVLIRNLLSYRIHQTGLLFPIPKPEKLMKSRKFTKLLYSV